MEVYWVNPGALKTRGEAELGDVAVVMRYEALAIRAVIVRDHYLRRDGWRGVVDLLLRRKPLRVIDEVEFDRG